MTSKTTEPAKTEQTDHHVVALAMMRHHLANEGRDDALPWGELPDEQREQSLKDATLWLRAVTALGLTPPVERPTSEHDAVLLDNYGQLWGEYQTSPSSHGDAILRLVWASEECSSRAELEERGVDFQLIGWSQ